MTARAGLGPFILVGAMFSTLGLTAPEDIDGDGILDGSDNCPARFNPDQLDVDDDSVGDVCDNCPDDVNPDQSDHDGPGFGPFATYHLVTGGYTFVVAMLPADIDGDGDLDMIVQRDSHYFSPLLDWYENLGDGEDFSGPNQIAQQPACCSLIVSDLDGDGDLDIVDARIRWYENDGSGNFSPHSVVSPPVAFMLGEDIDGDGDNDLVASSSAGIVWYRNLDGSGTFDTAEMISASGADSFVIADIDGNGQLDIVAPLRSGGIALYRNRGGAQFDAETLIAAEAAAWVATGDLDLDGDLDLVSAADDDARVSWYEGLDGSGTFAAGKTIAVPEFPAVEARAVDVDLDGDLDILFGTFHAVFWIENLAAASRTIQEPVALRQHARGIDLAPELSAATGLFATVRLIRDHVYLSPWYRPAIRATDFRHDRYPEIVLALNYYRGGWFENGADTVGDVCDNCPDLPNICQDDSDGNGVGDACDTAP